MRDIKFRGISIDTGKFIYGNVFFSFDGPYISDSKGYDFHDVPMGVNSEKVKPETVGQYTGLKDKNGKEIYKGDIFKWIIQKGTYCGPCFDPGTIMADIVFGLQNGRMEDTETFISEVIFENGMFLLSLIKDRDFKATFIDKYVNKDKIGEVIGNRYENAELMPQT